MSKFIDWCKNYWQDNVYEISVILVALIFLLYRLSEIGQGLSAQEKIIQDHLIQNSIGLHYLYHNLVFLPYNVGLYVLEKTKIHSLFSIRFVGVVFGVIAAIEFFYLIRRLFGNFIASLTTLVFIDSLWFLQAARTQQSAILYCVGILTVALIGFIKHNENHKTLKLIISLISASLILYIPGMIWFLLALVIIKRKRVVEIIKSFKPYETVAAALVFLLIISPILAYSVQQPSLLRQLVGLPTVISPHVMFTRFYSLPSDVFLRTVHPTYLNLGHLPALDIFSTVLMVLGVVWLYLKSKINVIISICIGLSIGWVLYVLGGSIYTIIPLLLIFFASGISYLIKQWFTVFPRNPVAQKLGLTLLALAVISIAIYHANQFYIAWPRTSQTISIFSQES
jgi:hypothetical protein